MVEKTLLTQKDLNNGINYLLSYNSGLIGIIENQCQIKLRKREEGFSCLFKIIVGQQLSTSVATKIWNRIEENGLSDAETVLLTPESDLLSVGLSKQKCNYVRALASESIDYKGLRLMSSEEVIERLTSVKGIGRWTAQMYCMFSLARANIFPAGDLALKEAFRINFNLTSRPTEAELEQRAELWVPWKTVAALVLWEFYRGTRVKGET